MPWGIKRCLTSAPSGVDRWFAALNMTTMLKRRRHCHPEQSEGSLKVTAQHDNYVDDANEEMFRCAQHDNYVGDANEEMFRCAQHDSNAIAVPEQREGYE